MKQVLFSVMFAIWLGLISACLTTPPPPPPQQQQRESFSAKTVAPDYQWVQLGAEGAVIVRAIFKQRGQNCPNIETTDNNGNTAPVAMALRAAAMPDHFAVTVCEATLPAPDKLRSATLGGKNLTLPVQSPKRIVVIGDTGCRVSVGEQQNCTNNPYVPEDEAEKWLFTTTVESAVRLKPDLVIHVGDYIYREAACVHSWCGESTYGDNWTTWEADFFGPADSLLETAPWIFARGNHESCQREWRGWYLLLDPHSAANNSWTETECTPRSAPFQVPLDGLDLLVMDTAPDTAVLNDYQAVLQKHTGSSPAWFITHRPFWGIGKSFDKIFTSVPRADVIPAIQNANVKFLVGGHLHSFEMIQFTDNSSPPQMIAGGGATELDDPVHPADFDQAIKALNADVNNSEFLHQFTFVLVEPQRDGWHVTVIDQDGTTEKREFVIKNK